MQNKMYTILFSGEIKENYSKEQVIINLSKVFKVPEANIQKLFSGDLKVIKRNIDRETAEKYFRAFSRCGAICKVKAIEVDDKNSNIISRFKETDLMRCPRCKYQQRETQKCIRCGYQISKDNTQNSFLDIIQNLKPAWAYISGVILIVFFLMIAGTKIFKKNNVADSIYLTDIQINNFESITPPSSPVDLKWSFFPNKEYKYNFKQTVCGKMKMDGFSKDKGNELGPEMTMQADILIRCKSHNSADLIFNNISSSATFNSPDIDIPNNFQQTQEAIVIQGMNEYGSFEEASNSFEESMSNYFTLPRQILNIGDTVELPSRMFFNAMGSRLIVNGTNKLTLKGFKIVGPYRCAEIESTFDISNLEIPPELNGEYKFSIKGKSIYYFDIENDFYVYGKRASLTQFHIKTQKFGQKFNMSSTSDELTVIQTKELNNMTL